MICYTETTVFVWKKLMNSLYNAYCVQIAIFYSYFDLFKPKTPNDRFPGYGHVRLWGYTMNQL